MESEKACLGPHSQNWGLELSDPRERVSPTIVYNQFVPVILEVSGKLRS